MRFLQPCNLYTIQPHFNRGERVSSFFVLSIKCVLCASKDAHIPETPVTHTIPLPTSPLSTTLPLHSTNQPGHTDALYPINVLVDIPTEQELELRNILLTYPIHVHAPQAHIGTIYAASTNHYINSFDLLLFLRIFAGAQPNFVHTPTYPCQLTPQTEVEPASTTFRHSMHQLPLYSSAMRLTEGHLSMGYRYGDLMDMGLLLGNVNVWGLEGKSVYGYSVVHIA